MSGGNIPYHLRPNKHIERVLFVELLDRLLDEPNSYAYFSMGGPQLEDHRLIHQELGIKQLFSFEKDKNVYERQIFNLRPSCINCIDQPMRVFVDEFETFVKEHLIEDKRIIVWLDYATPRRRNQLQEYEKLLKKLETDDIIKITLNANPDSLGVKQDNETFEMVNARRLETLSLNIGDYMPPNVTPDDMNSQGLRRVLCNAIKVATERGLERRPRLKPALLSLFAYQDGYHQMLTATIQLQNASQLKRFLRGLDWEYLPEDWNDVQVIDVPSLTARERLEIDRMLPIDDVETLQGKLPFKLDTDEERSKEFLREYVRHYRRYPSYFQVYL